MLALAPSSSGISVSVSNDVGGFTENINADDGDSVYGSAVIGSDSLSNSIEGNGDFSEDHWISNTGGDKAGVGVDIRNAQSYYYSWMLGGSINPNKVWAGEDVVVINASYISAYANSSNARGNNAGVSTVLFDYGNRASLDGYSNLATASANDASASQSATMAYAPYGSILTEAEALTISPDDLAGEKSEAKTTVLFGSIENYTDSAKASLTSRIKLDVSQSIGTAKGEQIDTESRSMFGKANAEVSTETFGVLHNYKGTATKYNGIPPYTMDVDYGDSVEAGQSAHISGYFKSAAVGGSASKTRTSNYGDEYDLNMQASNGYAFGTLGYYVDVSNPIANSIQGAVDASESYDTINVAEGTYKENVLIDKSLTVSGSGASDTIVDGQQSGSVFAIGENNPNAYVSLSGLTIQGGSDSGIKNFASLRLKDSTISGNTAYFGGGISSYGNGTVAVYGGSIIGNTANIGGGIFSEGKVNLAEGSIISGNRAHGGGGGIYIDHGTVNLYKSSISGNIAGNDDPGTVDLNGKDVPRGGGIYSNQGTVNLLMGGNITNNSAPIGGGIYSVQGTVNLRGGNIIGNKAIGLARGGGIFSEKSTVNLIAGSISYNNATGGNGGGIYDYFGTIKGDKSLVHDNIPDDIYRPTIEPLDPLVTD